MTIVFPWIFFSLLWMAFVGRSGLRQGFVYAAIVYTCCLVFATETLSKWSSLGRWELGVFWIGLTVLSGFYLLRHGDRKDAVRRLHEAWAQFQGSRIEISAVVLILASVLLIAVVAPPNNWESLNYRMARVAMWVEQGNIGHYPTHYLPQLYQPPLGEWNILHFQILSGSDRFANTVEWSALAGCGIVASLIARELKKSFPVQVLAAVMAVTLPMGLMQGASTQNVLLASFWSLAFAMFAIRYVNSPSARCLACCGFTLGFALLSKATVYVIAPGIAAALFLYGLIRAEGFLSRAKLAAAALVIVVMALALNIGHYARNWDLFGHPVAPTDLTHHYVNHKIDVSVVMANLVRNSALHLGVPSNAINDMTLGAVRRVFGDFMDEIPGTTHGRSLFRTGIPFGINEYVASNFLHFWLLAASVCGILLFRRRFQFDTLTIFYALAVISGTFSFCALLQWEQWNQRYHTTIFMIGAPIAAVFVANLVSARAPADMPAEPRMDARYSGGQAMRIVAGMFLVSSIPWILLNELRPLVSHHANGVHRESILSADRVKMYFASEPFMFQSYADAVKVIAPYNPREIGLLSAATLHDYAVRVLFRMNLTTNFQLRYVGVENVSKNLREDEFAPPFIFSNRKKLPLQVAVEEGAYFTVWKSSIHPLKPEHTVLMRRDFADEEMFPDVLTGDTGNNVLFGGSGADTLRGGGGDDRLEGGAGADDLDGGEGTDTVSYRGSGAGVTVALADSGTSTGSGGDAAGDTLRGFENIEGSEYADVLTGNAGSNVLSGHGGGDRLYGGAGADTLRGGAGADDLDGGEGTDAVSYQFSNAGVTVTLTDDGAGTASGGDATGDRIRGFENIEGSSLGDVLTGHTGSNVLRGRRGADTLRGVGGADVLRGGRGDDRLEGGAGADALDGGQGVDTVSYRSSSAGVTVKLKDDGTGTASGGDAAGDTLRGFEHVEGSEYADVLTGNAGSNVLSGHGGVDTLRGGAGDDRLDGGAGADTLTGGEGGDLFRSDPGGGADTITDFTDGEDRIDICGHRRGESFSDLTITRSPRGDAMIDLGNGDRLTLTGASADVLDGSDFLVCR